MKWRGIMGAILFGTFAGIMILKFRWFLIPDTFLHSQGKAAWSSPVISGVGFLFGLRGVQIAAILSAAALGYWVGQCGLRFLSIAATPPGFSIAYAGADALGALGAGFFARSSWKWSVAIAALHLQAALVFLFVKVAERLQLPFLRWMGIVAGALAMVAQWHIQMRYLLPGIILAICPQTRERG